MKRKGKPVSRVLERDYNNINGQYPMDQAIESLNEQSEIKLINRSTLKKYEALS